MPLPDKTAFFLGCTVPVCVPWFVSIWMGAQIGASIPAEYGLDFIVPIAFIALFAPALRSLAHIAAAFTSIVLALALVALPFNLGLLVAGICAMIVGAEVERRLA